MNYRRVRNNLRLLRAWVAGFGLLLLGAGALVCLFLSAWWHALAIAVLFMVLLLLHRRTFVLAGLLAQSLRAFQQGQLIVSETNLRAASPLAEQLAPDDPTRGIVYLGLARVTRLLGNYDEAEAFALKAMNVHRDAWGSEDVTTLETILLLAAVYVDIARYRQAKSLLDGVLQIAETTGSSFVLAECLGSLGRWWSEQGYPVEAEPLLRRAIEMVRSRHHAAISLRLGLASVQIKLKNIHEAEALTQCLLKDVHLTGAESLVAANCLERLAAIRLLQGNVGEAENLARQALVMTEKISGPNTPALASPISLLGGILKVQRKWREAEDGYRDALRLREEYLAPEHPALAELLEEYAELLEMMGREHEAHQLEHRAQLIREFHANPPPSG